MTTFSTDTVQSIRQHFADNWNPDDPVKVIYVNQPAFDLAEKQVWCRFSVRLGESFHDAGSSSSGITVQQGRVWLQVFTPSGTGDSAALRLIDHFNSLFRHERLDNGSIRFTTPDIDLSPIEDEGYLMQTVSIPFEAYERLVS